MKLWDMIKNAPKVMELLREGKEVANPVTWKNTTVVTNALIALLGTALGLAKGFGYDLNLDDATVHNLAGGVLGAVAAWNAIVHCITDSRVGLPSNGGSAPAAEQPVDGGKPQ